ENGGFAQAISIPRERVAKPAGRTAEDQPRTAGKSQTARRAKCGSRTEEHRSGAGTAGARRKGRAVGPYFKIQIRIPRQHVTRAADAAQQPAHPRRSTRSQRGRQSYVET